MKSHNHNLRSQIRLLLLRHAKSNWDNPELPDIDRPLAPRGIMAAGAIGKAMARGGLQPDLVLCSPARRTRDTWKIVSAELPRLPETRIVAAVYNFGHTGNLLDVIRTEGGDAQTLLVVGHNPSLEELALKLIGFGEDAMRRRLETKFPTGTLAVIRFERQDWSQLTEAKGELTHFIRPRDVLRAPSV